MTDITIHTEGGRIVAFGPIMQVKVSEDLLVELAPLSKGVMGEFVSPGMQRATITRYLKRRNAYVFEDELEWFERTRLEKNSLAWGIYVLEGDTRTLIGTSAIHNINHGHVHQGVTGSLIFRDEYWGKGIASAIHKARTWFAFQHLGLHCLRSAVLRPNHGSRKALQKSGYEIVSTERNTSFVNGQLMHQDNLECLNPAPEFWRQWWHGDRVPKPMRTARERTRAALEWASENVTLL